MSDSNRTALAFKSEVTLGTIPAPLVLKRMRFTKEALEFDKQTVRSEEIAEDRQLSESVRVGIGAKGTVDFELAVTDFEPFFEAALGGTFAANVLKNGTTRQSFVLEKKFNLAGGVTSFFLFRGMTVNQLTLTLNAKQIITGQMDFLGMDVSEAAVTGDTSGAYDDAGTGLILSASTNVANMEVDGVAATGIKSLTLTIANNNRAKDAIGKEEADDIGQGSFTVTGKMDAYFNDRTLIGKFIDHEDVDISFDVQREAAGAIVGDVIGYTFLIAKAKITKGNPSVGGQNQDVMLPLEFAAEKTAGAGSYTLSITRILKA